MKHGIAVAWDNPDIHLELGGVTVPSESLSKSTTYDIVARIWNGSTDAPAVKMPVRFSYQRLSSAACVGWRSQPTQGGCSEGLGRWTCALSMGFME